MGCKDKLFSDEDAQGILDVVRNYLMRIPADLPQRERRSLGRLIEEVQISLEIPTDVPSNVRPLR